jgi:alpha-tubulin suppressor-like RCC1 family protein
MKTKFYFFILLLLFPTLLISQCWNKIATKFNHTMAISTNGQVSGWGQNSAAQLGNSSNIANATPAIVWEGNNWSKIYAGTSHSMGIKNDGTLWACGSNNYGELGNGTTNTVWIPIQVGTSSDWAEIATGSVFCIGLKTNGTLWAWGTNGNAGYLGNNSTVTSLIPIQIGTDNDWIKISSGLDHTLAIKSNGTLWAWGYNGYGNLGDGTYTNRLVPTQIGLDNNWTDVYVGDDFSFAKKTNGNVYAWGKNDYSNLGNQSFSTLTTPTLLSNLNDFVSFSCGNAHVIAIKNDGTLWGWGKNGEGQLGLGTNSIYQGQPIQIGTSNNWVKIASGYNHSFAINNNNQLYAFGNNSQVQLGTEINSTNNIPTQVGCSNLDTNDYSTSIFEFYPNPTKDYLYFENEIKEISIYSLDGRKINTNFNKNKIDVSYLNNGIYLLQLIDNYGKLIKKKFIKN